MFLSCSYQILIQILGFLLLEMPTVFRIILIQSLHDSFLYALPLLILAKFLPFYCFMSIYKLFLIKSFSLTKFLFIRLAYLSLLCCQKWIQWTFTSVIFEMILRLVKIKSSFVKIPCSRSTEIMNYLLYFRRRIFYGNFFGLLIHRPSASVNMN